MALFSCASSVLMISNGPPSPFLFPYSNPTKKPLKSFHNLNRTPTTLRCSSLQPGKKQPAEEFERLFSNLNQATMKREPGDHSTCNQIVIISVMVLSLYIFFDLQAASLAESSWLPELRYLLYLHAPLSS